MDLADPTKSTEAELDSEISSIRREIRNLQRRRRFLSSSIFSSESLQKRLGGRSQPNTEPAPAHSPNNPLFTFDDDISPLVHDAGKHAQSNHHRIAFSTTTFPFKDPSPTTASSDNHNPSPNLLGVRIDICARNGRFVKPYYLLLKRVGRANPNSDQKPVRVHRHTIPAFIPLEQLERVFLPDSSSHSTTAAAGTGDGDVVLKQSKGSKAGGGGRKKQDLRGFVREVRRQLVAWHARMDTVKFLREQLGVIRRGVDEYDGEDGGWEKDEEMVETKLAENELGIVALAATALEAAYVRLEWTDGTVGRFKVSNSGLVERAVVIGDGGRDKALEAAMTGGDRRVVTVLDRLKKHTSLRREDEALDTSE